MTVEALMPRFLTVKEVAVIVRRSEDTIYRWLKEGMFPGSVKVKDGYLIPEDAVLKLTEPH